MRQLSEICTIHVKDRITLVKYTDAPDFDEAVETLAYLRKHNIYHYRCFDFHELTFNFSHDEVRRLVEISKLLFNDKSYTCFVAQNTLTFGTLRQIMAYRQEEGVTSANVVSSVEEAFAWLKSNQA